MAKSYRVADVELFVFSEEINTNPTNGIKYYDAVCKCNGNTILFSKTIKDGETNIISNLLKGLDEEKTKYLAEKLKNNNVLVLISEKEDIPFYVIYCDFTEKLLTPHNLYRWMFANNDFAEETLFAEVHNGHQTALFGVKA